LHGTKKFYKMSVGKDTEDSSTTRWAGRDTRWECVCVGGGDRGGGRTERGTELLSVDRIIAGRQIRAAASRRKPISKTPGHSCQKLPLRPVWFQLAKKSFQPANFFAIFSHDVRRMNIRMHSLN
jgi:hypothetical protein